MRATRKSRRGRRSLAKMTKRVKSRRTRRSKRRSKRNTRGKRGGATTEEVDAYDAKWKQQELDNLMDKACDIRYWIKHPDESDESDDDLKNDLKQVELKIDCLKNGGEWNSTESSCKSKPKDLIHSGLAT